MQIRHAVVTFLEWLNVRCSECGTWWYHVSALERRLECGMDVGGVLKTDPVYATFKLCGCRECGHTLSTRHIGDEAV